MVKKFLLLLGDLAILYLALILTIVIRYGTSPGFAQKLQIHLLPFSFLFAIWLVIFYAANLYEISFSKNDLALFTAYSYATGVVIFLSIAFFYLLPVFRITPKTNFFIFLAIELAMAVPWRYWFNRFIAQRGFRNNTIILGISDQSQEMYSYLLANPQLGYNVLGIVDVQNSTAPEALEKLILPHRIRTLILAPTAYRIPRIIDVLYQLVRYKINFYNLSDFFERVTGKVPLGEIDQAWFLENLTEGSKRPYETGKRIFDLILAAAIGLITLPFYPIIIVAIKLDSEGPIFYRQRRIGQAGQVFTLVKFRNMIKNAESQTGPVWASEDDRRATTVGRFLRRSRFDELPQIWNILRGEMSFIGPRPERPEFHDRLKQEIPFYEERYLIKPGLTGWAQIKFKLDFKGGMTIRDTFEKLQYDLFYIKNRSPLLDLSIVLKTINIVSRKFFNRL